MIHETIKLLPNSNATLTSYIHDKKVKKKAMLIFPGGGYGSIANHEGEPIALAYMAANFNTFVLKYSTEKEAKNYAPLIEASYAMKYIRENADKLNVDADNVFVIGFSAGAHLAAWLGTSWDNPKIPNMPYKINKPKGMILSYPLISSGEYRYVKAFIRLSGKSDPTDEERAEFSVDKLVSENTCPAFIWHTFNDETVNVEHSLIMAKALKDNNIPFEMHIFPNGAHGYGLATEMGEFGDNYKSNDSVAQWFNLSLNWIKNI